mmetsp:Transcript_57/g.156  ORF Transcript_57/g.156 Transcript_57/m.156 type:complete len:203 (+) Transcript_57:1101-1709(+)
MVRPNHLIVRTLDRLLCQVAIPVCRDLPSPLPLSRVCARRALGRGVHPFEQPADEHEGEVEAPGEPQQRDRARRVGEGAAACAEHLLPLDLLVHGALHVHARRDLGLEHRADRRTPRRRHRRAQLLHVVVVVAHLDHKRRADGAQDAHHRLEGGAHVVEVQVVRLARADLRQGGVAAERAGRDGAAAGARRDGVAAAEGNRR